MRGATFWANAVYIVRRARLNDPIGGNDSCVRHGVSSWEKC